MSELFPTISRRALLAAAGSVIAMAALPAPLAFAQRRNQADVDVAELMKPGPLPEVAIGPADAKVTIVEYASMTCPHCAHFHKEVFPELKKKYVETGKVRFVFREFPLDDVAAGASMLSRCVGKDDPSKSYDLTAILYDKQEDWAFVRGNPLPKMFDIAKQVGFTKESFDKCLTDQKLLDEINAVRDRGSKVFGISATPSFFVNGKRLNDAPTVANFDKLIEPFLKAS